MRPPTARLSSLLCWVAICRSEPRSMLVKSDEKDPSERRQMSAQVFAITPLNTGEHGASIRQGRSIQSLELLKPPIERLPVHAFRLRYELGRQTKEPLITGQGLAQAPRFISGPVALVRLLARIVKVQAMTAGK